MYIFFIRVRKIDMFTVYSLTVHIRNFRILRIKNTIFKVFLFQNKNVKNYNDSHSLLGRIQGSVYQLGRHSPL